MPAYNAEATIEKAIKSVVAQSLKDIELIIVNDGSVDNTRAVIKNFVETCHRKDLNIYVFDQVNKGVGCARNLGLANASGEYIGWIDADDEIPENYFSTLIAICEFSGSKIGMCDILFKSQGGENSRCSIFEESKILPKEKALFELCKDDACKSWIANKVFHKSLFNEIRFPMLVALEDYAIMHKLFDNCKHIAYTKDICYICHENVESLTRKMTATKQWNWIFPARDRYEYMLKLHPNLAAYAFRVFAIFVLQTIKYSKTDDSFVWDNPKKRILRKYIFQLVLLSTLTLKQKVRYIKYCL